MDTLYSIHCSDGYFWNRCSWGYYNQQKPVNVRLMFGEPFYEHVSEQPVHEEQREYREVLVTFLKASCPKDSLDSLWMGYNFLSESLRQSSKALLSDLKDCFEKKWDETLDTLSTHREPDYKWFWECMQANYPEEIKTIFSGWEEKLDTIARGWYSGEQK